MCGDSLDRRTREAVKGAAGEARLCVTDPPWGVKYRDTHKRSIPNDTNSWCLYNTPMVVSDLAADGAPVLVFAPIAGYGLLQMAMENAGFRYRDTVIWVKNNFVIGHGDMHKRYESIWFGTKGTGHLHPNKDRTVDNVWNAKTVPNNVRIHPNQKPVDLVERCVTLFSDEGDLVCDPFGGSGTTLMACERTGRRCLMMEINFSTCDRIVERWESETGRTADIGRLERRPTGAPRPLPLRLIENGPRALPLSDNENMKG